MKKNGRVIVICGSTATGKTSLALALARKFKSEIINFDSVQVYKEFDIGTAKPSRHELELVKHRLIDEVEPDENFTAGDFRRRALEVLEPGSILCGGTGFYLQALLKGMFEAPPANDFVKHKLAAEVKSLGLEKLHLRLKQLDPETAARIHINDQYRIIRALEIIQSEGKTLSEIKRKFVPEPFPFSVLKIGLRREKDKLREAIAQRSAVMMKNGLIAEVKGLVAKWGRDIRPLQAVGYKEALEFLNGNIGTERELAGLISLHTLQLAKRQATWFKRDLEIHWMDPDKQDVVEDSISILDKNP